MNVDEVLQGLYNMFKWVPTVSLINGGNVPGRWFNIVGNDFKLSIQMRFS